MITQNALNKNECGLEKMAAVVVWSNDDDYEDSVVCSCEVAGTRIESEPVFKGCKKYKNAIVV